MDNPKSKCSEEQINGFLKQAEARLPGISHLAPVAAGVHPIPMPRVIITGGPGAGKTSVLRALSRLGYRTVQESARDVIAERLAAGLSPRPDPAAFALEILRRDIEKYEREQTGADCVFHDRAIPEALGMVRDADAMSPERVTQLLAQYGFHRQVFVLPPWEAIYRQDAQRDQTYAEAVAVHAAVVGLYRSLGYELIEVPKAPVQERARYIVNALATGTAWATVEAGETGSCFR